MLALPLHATFCEYEYELEGSRILNCFLSINKIIKFGKQLKCIELIHRFVSIVANNKLLNITCLWYLKTIKIEVFLVSSTLRV